MQNNATGDCTRDLKRARTFRRIHEAAVELALRDGLAAATVSDIADRAEVSRRTFFNYFPSKEDAVLGIQEPQIPPAALEAFLHPALPPPDTPGGGDRFSQALELTVTTMASFGPRTSTKVRAILSAHPELVDRIGAHRTATQELLVTALTERLAEEHRSAGTADSARALILLAGAVLRFAYGDDPDFLDDPDPTAVQAAVTAFRDALKDFK